MQTKTSGEDNNSSNSPTQPLTSTSILGVKLYAFILICISLFLFLLVLVFFFIRKIKQSHGALVKHSSGIIPLVSKDVKSLDDDGRKTSNTKKMGDMMGVEKREGQEVGILKGERKKSGESDRSSSWGSKASAQSSAVSVEFQNIGWGRWYSLKELEIATCGFSDENVIGEGGHGIVYRGVLDDGSVVAVKNLLNNKGQAEKEFKVEVEAIGKVRHKYLVGLLGYCAEGAQRMLVYEYADNGNLEQWLHGDVGPVSPMTWDIRMKIAIGIAKGLAYLHDGLDPKVVHRDVKSSNILLDKNWNPMVSDFGLAKLLGSGASYVTTRVMGTFGYVSPEYASTGMLSEESDVYSFGVLLMELITGRSPIDHSKPPGERNLVDWFKGMIASHCGEDVVDSLIEVHPSPRALKRALLVCLRCIDLDATKRPKMGQIVHMLEADKFPFRTEHRSALEVAGLSHVSTPANELQRPPDDHVVSDEQRARWR